MNSWSKAATSQRVSVARRFFSSLPPPNQAKWPLGAVASAVLLVGVGSSYAQTTTSLEPSKPLEEKKSSPLASALAALSPLRVLAEPHRLRGQPRNVMLHRMRSKAGRGLNEKYNVDWKTVLGEGSYGSVHPARVAATGEKVALKKIAKRYTNSSTFKNETEALLRIYDNGGHPNISGLRDMYEDHSHFYLILDLISGGEMFDHLSNDGAYSEADAARLVYEVASALAFLHGVGVVHADLKPENLLLCSKNRRDGTIKIIDFGCAVLNPEVTPRNDEETGTTGYWPPERFLSNSVTSAADMWSLGVILYIMLTGVHPFDLQCDRNDEQVAEAIKKDPRAPLDPTYVGHLSESAIELIALLMEPDPEKRLNAYQMLHHPWVQGETASTAKMMDSDKRLSHFQDLRHKFEASIFAWLVNHGHQDMTLSEAKHHKDEDSERKGGGVPIMKMVFDVLDEEHKGYVTGSDIGRLVTEHTGEVLSKHHTNEFLKSSQKHGAPSQPEAEVSLSDLTHMMSGIKQKHFPRGHYIFHAGEEGSSMYFLSSGKVEIQTRKGQLVALLRSGDFFGEGSLLDEGRKRFTSAKCTTPVDVLEIKREDFDRYTKTSSETRNELKRKWRARHLYYAKNLLRLQTNVKFTTLKKGDYVYKEGEKGTAMYRVDDTGDTELEVLHGDTVVHKYLPGDSFGESSLLFDKPRSSTVRCASDSCRIFEMRGEDFMAVVDANPSTAATLRNMCRKRLLKKAVKQFSLYKKRGLSDEDLVAAFHDADLDKTGYLNIDELSQLMRRMDPKYPMSEIHQLMKFVDVDEDGKIGLEEFKKLFRQFEEEKN
eukprot:Nitzschia sp. Nitz4//scaffold23_size168460//94488//97284//NITZ4_002225-RA/size168460-snap-gene-0.162-mRNA-1//-1//CDS//3329543653//7078//frame0